MDVTVLALCAACAEEPPLRTSLAPNATFTAIPARRPALTLADTRQGAASRRVGSSPIIILDDGPNPPDRIASAPPQAPAPASAASSAPPTGAGMPDATMPSESGAEDSAP